MNTIIESLEIYFANCPLLTGGRMNIDYLPESTAEAGIEYAISAEPGDHLIKQYLDGSQQCRYPYILSGVHDYGPDEAQNILNSGFYEQLANWIWQQSRARNLPILPQGETSLRMRAMGHGYLYQPDVNSGKYQIQCELEYYKKGA